MEKTTNKMSGKENYFQDELPDCASTLKSDEGESLNLKGI
jgi:hypothetical protein